MKPRILVAGIGNIFMGDDAFGVEVARRLMERNLPDEVRVVDFGIRGLDLAYALQDGYETTILIDAYPHGQPPGTVSVVEPDVNEISAAPGSFVEPHSLHPMNVLRMAHAMNGLIETQCCWWAASRPHSAEKRATWGSATLFEAVGRSGESGQRLWSGEFCAVNAI